MLSLWPVAAENCIESSALRVFGWLMSTHGLHYFLPAWIEDTSEKLSVDVCIYGGTAAGVVAAMQLKQLGKSVVVLNPANVVGGMTTGGLGWTDYGQQHVIGGLARQFYRDLGAFYGVAEEWYFEPHAAQNVMDGYIARHEIDVRHRQYLDAVEKEGAKIRRVKMLGGLEVTARVFMDCTYEGDLLAKAGVGFHVGRESNRVYDETVNGVQVRGFHQFSSPVDPYIEKGNPQSGVLPFVEGQDIAPDGSGDNLIQAYNFRVCMTDDPDLKIDWEKPDGYRDFDYELARRWFNAEKDDANEPCYSYYLEGLPKGLSVLTARTKNGFFKTDTNNHGAVSSDFIGGNYLWPSADYALREEIFQNHVRWQKGFYWCAANDREIPARYQEMYRRFGLARDEFESTAHWPHQLYVREARRMVSAYVMNEHDMQLHRTCDDPIGMGSYTMDSHNCRRFVREGRVLNEGDVQLPVKAPYSISYRALVPRREECENLLVPVCLSASHIAFGSIRMEPVFMVLAQSAAHAATLALEQNGIVQDVDYADLRAVLEQENQVLETQ